MQKEFGTATDEGKSKWGRFESAHRITLRT